MDLNGDGLSDVLSGSWPGEIYLFLRQPDGDFAAAEKLTDQEGEAINVGSASAAFAADWDGDADFDLVVGNISGDVFLIPNQGSPEEYRFGTPEKLEADGEPIRVPGGDAGPTVADWDADGRDDLLVGTDDGSVLWYRNVGTSAEPSLAAAETLVPATEATGMVDAGGPAAPGRRAKICASDWNGDGRLDLLLGDFLMQQEKRPEPTEEEKLAEQQSQKTLRTLLKEYGEIAKAPVGEPPEAREKRQQRMAELIEQITELQRSGRRVSDYAYHGRVWLFLREGGEQATETQ